MIPTMYIYYIIQTTVQSAILKTLDECISNHSIRFLPRLINGTPLINTSRSDTCNHINAREGEKKKERKKESK